MSSSQMKRAIDETIGQDSMLSESFVTKVMTVRKPKNKFVWIQPLIVLVALLFVAILLINPTTEQHSASQINLTAPTLTDVQYGTIEKYFNAIITKDDEAFAEVSDLNLQQVINYYYRYYMSPFEGVKDINVIRTIPQKNELHIYVKFNTGDIDIDAIHRLNYNTNTDKIDLGRTPDFGFYNSPTFPEVIDIDFSPARAARIMPNFDLSQYKLLEDPIELENGLIHYQLVTKPGIWHVLKTAAGQFIDVELITPSKEVFGIGMKDELYLINKKTSVGTMLYPNQQGNYQIVNGVINLENNFGKFAGNLNEELFIFKRDETTTIGIIRNGQLVEAHVIEPAKLTGIKEFYEVNAVDANEIEICYQEDGFTERQRYYLNEELNLVKK